MLFAANMDDLEKLKELIEEGIDINWQHSNIDGGTALHEAARKGNVDILQFLLRNGASVDSQNYNGLTPLHVAVYCGQNMAASSLIEQGANVNARARDGITPLHAAASIGHFDTVELLIREGAEAHARSSKGGLTPHDFALREGHEAVANVLSRN